MAKKVVRVHAASLNQQDNPLNPLTDFHSLSLRDLLEARDLYHLHLTERKGVLATAVGRYLIRHNDSWPNQRPVVKHKGPKTLANAHIRPYSWPCVLVFVEKWVSEQELKRYGYKPTDVVPSALHMPNGKVVPVCVVEAPPDTLMRSGNRPPVFSKSFIGGGYPVIADVQGEEHMASIGCLVTDGHTTYAVTNRHVTGTPGETLYTFVDGQRQAIGVSSAKQIGRLPFGDVYEDWPGQNMYVNADVGLIEVRDKTRWTPQVYSIGVVDRLADLSIENISLQLVKARVRAYGCASGELYGRIWALFYRYKSVGGFEYVSDLFIGPRPGQPFQTYPGDSGTLWLLEPSGPPDPDDEPDDATNRPGGNMRAPEPPGKPARRARTPAVERRMLRPLALQWGGHAFRSGNGTGSQSFVLATFLSTVCNRLEVDLVRDWGQALPEYWGTIGHFTIANIACNLVGGTKAKQFFKDNRLNITFELGDITDAGTSGLSKKDFVPLADVPDLAWKIGAFVRGPRGHNPEEPQHFADLDEPPPDGSPTLLEVCRKKANIHPAAWIKHSRRFKKPGSKADPAKDAGLLPFRVWQIFDEMVAFVKAGKEAEYLTAAGVLAHYIGDACQPLHCSYMHHGDPDDPVHRVVHHTKGKKAGTTETIDDSKEIHEDYEQNMFKGVRGNDMKTRLAAKARRSGSRVKNGREAAIETVAMMRAAFTRVPPKTLIGRYNQLLRADVTKTELLDTLWHEFGDATVDVMAMGSRLLARLWESAWVQGGGDAKLKGGVQKQADLAKCYGRKTFLKSYLLTEIAAHLQGVPPEPK
jgi:hypothetical protein